MAPLASGPRALAGSVLLLALPSLRAQSREWETIAPGGDTGCGRGAEFRFQFRPGPAPGLVIDFQGGGACWDAATCAVSVLPSAACSLLPHLD